MEQLFRCAICGAQTDYEYIMAKHLDEHLQSEETRESIDPEIILHFEYASMCEQMIADIHFPKVC